MVEIGIGKNEIIITLDASEKFLALKRKISIPLANIVSVSIEKAKPSWLSIKWNPCPGRLYGRHILDSQGQDILLCPRFYKVRDSAIDKP